MIYGTTILLTGGRAPVTLHLARILKQQRCRVIVADTFSYTICAASNAVDRNVVIPAPRKDPQGFVIALTDIIREESVEYLMPTCEEVFHVALHRPHFASLCKVFCMDIDSLNILHQKYLFNTLLQDLQLPTPRSFQITSLEEAKAAVAEIPNFVLKPAYSRFGDKVIINNTGYLHPEKFASLGVNTKNPWVVQEMIEGEHFGSFSIVFDGVITAHALYPLQLRVNQGAATYFESTPVPEVEAIVQKIVGSNKFTGFIAFDFIRSAKDGLHYAIECNPRLTSGIHLFDVFDRLWDYSLGTTYPRPENKRMLTIAALLYSLPEGLRQPQTLLDVLPMFLDSRDAIFDWKDIRPFFAQFSTLWHFLKKSKQHKISVLSATTEDIEWNGEF